MHLYRMETSSQLGNLAVAKIERQLDRPIGRFVHA